MKDITLETHAGIHVLRDDLLEGGSKTRFLEQLLDPAAEQYLYASPAFGGFQIALAATAKALGKRAVIFVAKRNELAPNTLRAKELGAEIRQVEHGYLSVVQKRAKVAAILEKGSQYLEFGADYPEANASIAETTREITRRLGKEPDEIWCAIGSGTIFRGILAGTDTARVVGVQVGREYDDDLPARARVIVYPMPFDRPTRAKPDFPSMPNYDLKAWELCKLNHGAGLVLFWNVL